MRRASWLAIKHGTLLAFTGLVGLVSANERRGNCWLYAIDRLDREGGHISLRMTTHPGGWWTHASHTIDLETFTEANPTWPKCEWRWWWPPLIFHVQVQTWQRRHDD